MSKIIGKFILFLFVSFISDVIMMFFLGIIFAFTGWPPGRSFEIIMANFSYVVLGLMYWLFYGKNQLARFRQKRAREAELGLEKSPIIKKKYFIGIVIIIITFILMLLLSEIFNVSTENTWLGLIGVDIIFITLGIMLFDKAKSLQDAESNRPIFLFLYFILLSGAIPFFIVNVFAVLSLLGLADFI